MKDCCTEERREQILEIQLQMCWTVYEIKIEFYKMTRKIIDSFTSREMLS